MNRIGIVFGVFLFLATTAVAQQPVINTGGVVNAASYALSGLPNSGIPQGGMFIVFGTNLGPATLQNATSFPLPTDLVGTSISVTVSGTTTEAIMIYTSAGQVAAVLRSNTPTGTGTLTLTYNGTTSAPAVIQVVETSFGAFTLNQAGTGAAIITNASNQPITALNPASPGQVVILWGTGLGPISGDETQPPAQGNLPASVEVLVGSADADVQYQGRAGCCAGLDQINFIVPSGQLGCTIPVAVKINDIVSNFVTIAVSTSGPCSDPTGLSSEALQQLSSTGSLRIGSFFLSKVGAPSFGISGATTLVFENGIATFARVDQATLLQSQEWLNQVSIGGCVVSNFSGEAPPDPSFAASVGLDAGASLSVNGPNGTRQIPRFTEFPGTYDARFNTPPEPGTYITAGNYTFSGPGGADVGAFSSSINIGAPLNWTNSNITNVPRSQNLTIQWTGGPANGTVIIGGASYVLNADSTAFGASFFCQVPSGPGQFTVPAAVLLSLPPSTTIGFPPFEFFTGTLFTGVYIINPFTASGLDHGYVGYSDNVISFVNYQ